MKAAIIGYSGSGKSTLAAKLRDIYNCPVLYLIKKSVITSR
jgi:adenylate kinase family enzyme